MTQDLETRKKALREFAHMVREIVDETRTENPEFEVKLAITAVRKDKSGQIIAHFSTEFLDDLEALVAE